MTFLHLSDKTTSDTLFGCFICDILIILYFLFLFHYKFLTQTCFFRQCTFIHIPFLSHLGSKTRLQQRQKIQRFPAYRQIYDAQHRRTIPNPFLLTGYEMKAYTYSGQHADHKNPFLPAGYEIKAYTYSGQHTDHKKPPSCLQGMK